MYSISVNKNISWLAWRELLKLIKIIYIVGLVLFRSETEEQTSHMYNRKIETITAKHELY